MPYSKFTLDMLEDQFGIHNQVKNLFVNIEAVLPSEWLKNSLEIANELPLKSEKAKSEAIVFPLLIELRNRNNKFFTIHSGDTLTADESKGLDGECDFILAKDSSTFNINFPILQIVEAKKNDTEMGVAQCAAQLVGAKTFNEHKGFVLPFLYGCVTTGKDWLFIRLEDKIYIDKTTYRLENIEILLGIFQSIIDFYKQEFS